MAEITLTHTRGDTFTKLIRIRDADAVLVDLTGSTITFTVRKKIGDTSHIAQGTATLANQTTNTGEATITLAASNFNVPVGTYYYDIKWVDSSGVVTTFMKGRFEIWFNVTGG